MGGLFTALVVDADAEAAVPWLATAYVPGPSLVSRCATSWAVHVAPGKVAIERSVDHTRPQA